MTVLKRLLGIALLIFAGLMLHVTFPAWSSIFASAPAEFSPGNWQDAHKYRREAMARDFLDSRHPIGMHRDAITQLLGKPDHQSAGRLHYLVAITTADYMALIFELDGDGRVVKAHLGQT